MRRNIIKIDEEKCDGCGQCVPSCVEGALQIIDGKARLVSDVYCDGLGACLGDCPQGALTVEQRDADPFDQQAAEAHAAADAAPSPEAPGPASSGCPGSALRTLHSADTPASGDAASPPSHLGHWPVQLRLIPPTAPFLKGAHLLVCADCVAYAVPDIHTRYLGGRAVVVGCPKLDDLGYYREKLKAILAEADPQSVTVLRMEVPCCGGIAEAVLEARDQVRPALPVEIHVVSVGGDIRRHRVPGQGDSGQGDAR